VSGIDDDPVGGLHRTPLSHWHAAHGAKLVPFAGYEMPVQYRLGVMKEHQWTRQNAGLFDVSHMGLAHLKADDDQHETVARALETLVPGDIVSLPRGRQRYTQLTATTGGIIDDLMVSRSADPADDGWLLLVVNAARKAIDFAHMRKRLSDAVFLLPCDDFALVALQGPEAENVLAEHDSAVRAMAFMQARMIEIAGVPVHATRSGYTGEDGFELPLPIAEAERLWAALAADDRVEAIGLGARDSLRLEAGMPLYGHDIDEETTPVEASLSFSIGKARRANGDRPGGFPGADMILRQLANGTERKRVGLIGDGRAPMRGGTPVYADDTASQPIGLITSGCFGPTVQAAISMAYLPASMTAPDTRVFAEVRGKRLPARVTALPFHTPRYKR